MKIIAVFSILSIIDLQIVDKKWGCKAPENETIELTWIKIGQNS